MRRHCPFVVAVTAAAMLLPGTASAASIHKHRHQNSRSSRGYGFLPGYPPRHEYREYRPWYWYGGGAWYRGRWNGGGFGPCWRQTPIGAMWRCG